MSDRKDQRLAMTAWRMASSGRATSTMPFTVGYLQATLKAMGHRVGEHRAAKMIHHLERRKILQPAGSYRSKRHGFKVRLYRCPLLTASVRSKKKVKRRNERLTWWLHPLFGNPGGEPPPGRRKR